MAKIGKRSKALNASHDANVFHKIEDAINLVKSSANAKFDETIEISIGLGVDAKKSDQAVRGTSALPHGTGKTVRVAVFARDAKAKEAQDGGADVVGAEDLVEAILGGLINFDRCIATPDMMAMVGRVAKVLGPKGLMPNPKLGTVTMNVADAVKAAKAGEIHFRIDKAGIVHAGVGKASFAEANIVENIKYLIKSVEKAKPETSKGVFIRNVSVSSTMGIGVKVEPASVTA